MREKPKEEHHEEGGVMCLPLSREEQCVKSVEARCCPSAGHSSGQASTRWMRHHQERGWPTRGMEPEAQGPLITIRRQNQPSHLSTADPRRHRPSSYNTTSLDSEYVASLGLFIISTLAFYLTQDMHPPIHPRTNLPSSRWRPRPRPWVNPLLACSLSLPTV